MLGTSEASVMSALHRARTALDAELAVPRERAPLASSPAERDLVARFTDAFEAATSRGSSHSSPTMPDSRCPRSRSNITARRQSLASSRRPRRRTAGAVQTGPHARQRTARVRLLSTRPAGAHRARVRSHGPDPERQSRRRDHRLPRHEPLPALRAAADAPGVGAPAAGRDAAAWEGGGGSRRPAPSVASLNSPRPTARLD